MKRIVFLLFSLVCAFSMAQAGDMLRKSDKLTPRWVKHTPKSENPNMAYRVVQVYVDNLNDMHQESLKELANYLPQSWSVDRFAEWQVKGNGSNEIHVVMSGSAIEVPMKCQEVDSYWEYVSMGYINKYRCYVLYQVVRPGASAVEFTRLTDKYGFGAVALSIIPGAGQMYKGSYLKGGLIMGSAVLCVGGIILCETNKAGYKSLEDKEHNASKKTSYHNQANNWGTGSYICIGALAGLWIYNLIDAGVAPGARRMVIDNKFRGYSINIAPTMFDAYTPALMARITF